MKEYVLYFHRNSITNAIFYVGIGRRKRAYEFWNRNSSWKNYVKKYGKPKVEIAHDCLSNEDAIFWETNYIRMLGRKKYDAGGCLVNITLGGEGLNGFKWSEELKNQKREYFKLNGHPWSGRKHSDESKVKVSKSNTGKIRSQELKNYFSKTRKGSQNSNFNHKWTNEQKEAARARRIGMKLPKSWVDNIAAAQKGKVHSEEAKEKMRQSKLGKPRSIETKDKIRTTILNKRKNG